MAPRLGRTGRAEAAPLAREGNQVFGAAFVTAHAGEAVVEDAAVEEGVGGGLRRPSPEPVLALEVLFPRALDLLVELLDQVVQGRVQSPR